MQFDTMTDQELVEYYNFNKKQSVIKDNTQMVLKIALNSFYGAVGNASFRYYELMNAHGITSFGQSAIRFIGEEMNTWFQDKLDTTEQCLVYGDTDSVYFQLKQLTDKLGPDASHSDKLKLMQSFCDGDAQVKIAELYESFSKYVNTPVNKMLMDREALSVTGGAFIAKKKYFLAVDDLEGKIFPEKEPYWKIMGLEAIKAGSYTQLVRKELIDVIHLIPYADDAEIQEHVKDLEARFKQWKPEDVAFLKGVSQIDKFVLKDGSFRSGTPKHVRAAVVHNRYIKDNNIDVAEIKEGDKFKFIQLKLPNPTKEPVIGFHKWEHIAGMTKYIDWRTHWEKNMLSPLLIMLDAIGVSHKKINKLF